MSDDRIYMIYIEKRELPVDEDREFFVYAERRVSQVQDDDRVLEVYLP